MIRRPFLLKIFSGANMQRWNDKIRPVELRELDKQAHKMIIAYVLCKYEEECETPDFDCCEVIEGGIFEFLQRLIVTDLKPQLFNQIKNNSKKYMELNEWVYKEIKTVIEPLGSDFCEKFRNYFIEGKENINKKILKAAHFYATKWEFDIIERSNPNGYEIAEIKANLQKRQEESYSDIKGLQQLILYDNIKNFVDLCGQLRFQVRWSHIHMEPRVSVLGHLLIVAILSYLFSKEINACNKRRINNFFTGLFHDLPEVLTRDIIDPVKKSSAWLRKLIKTYENQEMKKIYGLIPESWHEDIKRYTKNEFIDTVIKNGKSVPKSTNDINSKFNDDKYNPRDGSIVKAADELAAFVEAYLARENAIPNIELDDAINLRKKYREKTISGINLGSIYADFNK
jgi:putative hydrolases of HD superfamily